MILEPIRVLVPSSQNYVSSNFNHIACLLSAAPPRHHTAEANQVSADVQSSSAGKIVIYEAVPRDESLNQPQAGLNVSVEVELIELRNHLS